MKLKAWWVTHLHSGKKYSSCVLSSDKYQASTYVEGQVLNVEECWKRVEEGVILSSSGWKMYFFDNHTSKDYEVSKEWGQFLKDRNLNKGLEDK